jgi:hypothetical protein
VTFLGCLDAIGQADQALSDLKWSKLHKAQAHPAGAQDIELQACAVKEMKKTVIGLTTKVQDPHKTGDAKVVRSTTKADQGKHHPHKGE